MNFFSNLCWRVCVLGLGMVTAACAAKVSTVDGHHDFIGKPHAPIELEYTLPSDLKPGQTYVIPAVLFTTRNTDTLEALLSSEQPGLSISSPQHLNFGSSPAKTRHEFNIEFSTQTVGQFYIRVLAKVSIGAPSQSRSFLIPLLIGGELPAAAQKATVPVQRDSQGEAIISMPAEVRQK